MNWLELAAAILPEVRNFLDITWTDEPGDTKLTGIIARGMVFVQRLTQRGLDFSEGTKERELLFEYCRYARAGASDEFPLNYRIDIVTFQTDERAKAYAEGQEQDTDPGV